jgi:hypothetical protein
MSVRQKHGTLSGYTSGCRCARCRKVWREYYRQRSQEQRQGRYFEGKTQGVRVHLTALGLEIARAVARRRGQSVDAVVEGALRRCGQAVQFTERTEG